jgi:hypothetical protein
MSDEKSEFNIYVDCGFTKLPPDAIVLSECKITYSQEPDSCSSNDEYQYMKLSTDDAGGGKFIVMETTRWAINSIDEFIAVLNDFKKRAGVK